VRLLLKILLSIILILFLLFGFILYFTNFRQYLYIKKSINTLQANKKSLALAEFYSQGKTQNFHSGTFASTNKLGGSGIFLWTDNVIKYYKTDSNTVFSFYNVCKIYKEAKDNSGTFSVNETSRTVTSDIASWSKMVTAGDFTQVIFAKDDEKAAREVIAYDVPLFIDFNIKELCPN